MASNKTREMDRGIVLEIKTADVIGSNTAQRVFK